jgi:hypothetical protein
MNHRLSGLLPADFHLPGLKTPGREVEGHHAQGTEVELEGKWKLEVKPAHARTHARQGLNDLLRPACGLTFENSGRLDLAPDGVEPARSCTTNRGNAGRLTDNSSYRSAGSCVRIASEARQAASLALPINPATAANSLQRLARPAKRDGAPCVGPSWGVAGRVFRRSEATEEVRVARARAAKSDLPVGETRELRETSPGSSRRPAAGVGVGRELSARKIFDLPILFRGFFKKTCCQKDSLPNLAASSQNFRRPGHD